MNNDLKIAEMLCTRLCHDLTGPIGAVNNGAEFLSEEGFNLQGQAVELIASSAQSAVSRLQFYRVAYGRVKENGEASLTDSQGLAKDYFAGSKITLDWPDLYTDASGVSVSMRMMRLLFNLLIIASSTLLRGGTISIRLDHEENRCKMFDIIAQGHSVKWEAETEDLLKKDTDVDSLSPKTVQYYLTYRLASELLADISVDVKETEIHFKVVQNADEEKIAADG